MGQRPQDVYCRCCGDGAEIMYACDSPGCTRTFCGGPESCLAWLYPHGAPGHDNFICPYCESQDRLAASGSRFVRNVRWKQKRQETSQSTYLEGFWPRYVRNGAVVCGYVQTNRSNNKEDRMWLHNVAILCIFEDMIYVEYGDPTGSGFFTDTLGRAHVSDERYLRCRHFGGIVD